MAGALQADRAHVRHALLLVALLSFHVAGPTVQSVSPRISILLLLPLYVVLLGSSALAVLHGRERLLVSVLAVPLGLAIPAVLLTESPQPHALPVAALPFLAYTSYVVFRGVLAPGVVDEARLLGSASVFILMAQVWAGVYSALEWIAPGSLTQGNEQPLRPGDLAYFSVVTQTTLGYGDIAPVSGTARALATLQAMAGLFYMAVVVARFAGGYRLGRPTGSDAGGVASEAPNASRSVE
jgi:hypothetical protein